MPQAQSGETPRHPAPRPSVVRTSAGPAFIRADLVAFILPGGGAHVGMTQVVTVQGACAIIGAPARSIAEDLWPGIVDAASPIGRIGPRATGGGVILGGNDGSAA